MRFPTIIGLLLVVFIVGGVIVSFETLSKLPISASLSSEPKNVQISNVSDTSFTVTWTTDTQASGALIISLSRGDQTVFDERDDMGKLRTYVTHSVTVRNLTGTTEYSLKILSNGRTYGQNGQPYRVRTFPAISTSPGDLPPAYGSVITEDNQPATGALVFLTLEGSQTLSSLIKPSGAWLIPLNLVRTQDGTVYLATVDRLTENILVRSDSKEAQATTDTLNDSPVPTMVLGKNYDFRKQQAKTPEILAQVPKPTSTPTVLGDQTTHTPQKQYAVTLVAPAERAAMTSQLPLISGTGVPGNRVTITIGITHPTSDTSVVGADGVFRYTPKKSLSPGKQTVTITTVNANNKPIAITHSFEILKSGTQVLGDATPSATLTPTIAPAFTPTPTATLAGQELPTSATTFPTIVLIAAGFILFAGGLVAFVIP